MTIDRPWMLVLLVIPLVWMLRPWQRQRSRRVNRLGLTCISAVVLVLALCQPELIVREAKMAVGVLADRSPSISGQSLKRESELIAGIEHAGGKNVVQTIPFRRGTPSAADLQSANLETAIRRGIASLPSGRVGRLVIISDGRENVTDALGAAQEAREFGVPIDTIPLVGRSAPALRLETATAPGGALTGEVFAMDLVVTSQQSAVAQVVVSESANVLSSTQVNLQPGLNHMRVMNSVSKPGDVELSTVIMVPGAGGVQFRERMAIHDPRLLLVSNDPSDFRLVKTLADGHLAVTHVSDMPSSFAGTSAIVLNNWNLKTIPPARKAALEQFVKTGGGLIVAGGEGTSPTRPSAPAERACVVLAIDKSAGMDGAKLALGKMAAAEAIENLQRNDLVGVLLFDSSAYWVVPIRQADRKDPIERAIEGIGAGGGVRIAPALNEALRRIGSVDAVSKHILLITDGSSEEVNTLALARQAAAHHVTISTVGLGDDAHREYLNRMAVFARGESHYLTDPWSLEGAVVREEIAYTNTEMIHRQPAPDHWRYGQGHAEVVASGTLSPNMIREVLPTMHAAQATVTYDSAQDEIVIDYRMRPSEQLGTVPDLVVDGPKDARALVKLEKIDRGVLRGHVPCQHASGLFHIQPQTESPILPELQVYRPEGDNGGSENRELLQQVSAVTGGHFNPSLGEIFDPHGRTIPVKLNLWPILVLIAFVLNALELMAKTRYQTFDGLRHWIARHAQSDHAHAHAHVH